MIFLNITENCTLIETEPLPCLQRRTLDPLITYLVISFMFVFVLSLGHVEEAKDLLHDDVGRGEEYRNGGDHREQREDDQTESINHHSGKFPIADELGLLVGLTHP